jgi:hypothetical protein
LARHRDFIGFGIDQRAAQIELAGHRDGGQHRVAGAMGGFLAFHHDQLTGRRLAAHLGLKVQQDLIEFCGFQAGPQAGERGRAGGREPALGIGADAQGAALVLRQVLGQLGQVFLPARRITQPGQEPQRYQTPTG